MTTSKYYELRQRVVYQKWEGMTFKHREEMGTARKGNSSKENEEAWKDRVEKRETDREKGFEKGIVRKLNSINYYIPSKWRSQRAESIAVTVPLLAPMKPFSSHVSYPILCVATGNTTLPKEAVGVTLKSLSDLCACFCSRVAIFKGRYTMCSLNDVI